MINKGTFEEILKTIKLNDLSNNIEIVKHPFVPQNDIFAIEERSDFFVQITKDDILSTFIMEILCSCKPFVLSDNRTFRFLNEIYNLNIPLVANTAEAIVDGVYKILSKEEEINYTELRKRKELCKQYFSSLTNKSSALILYESV